ncbi:MAG TPA: DUF1559 domain-containing protein [Pirellulales bacterium]|jgi:prepilin-type N-terminal cleavage/methylation domain-containing protein/prepilin-type processing-associated H-X9-DG protein
MPQRTKPSAGFTLVEVLLVIAIISLLVTLSIPAIQSAREAARRTQCMNNLHQYGLAVASFESQNGHFPSSLTISINGKSLEDSEWALHTYMADLLPHFEQVGLAAQYDFSQMFCSKSNLPVISTALPFAICPSGPSRDLDFKSTFVPSLMFSRTVRENKLAGPLLKYLDGKYTATYQGALADYTIALGADKGIAERSGYALPKSAVYGLESMFPFPVATTQDLASKVLALYSGGGSTEISRGLSAAEITDGLSNTFTMIEIAGRPEHWLKGGRYQADEPLDRPWADPRSLQQLKTVGSDTKLVQADNREGLFSFHAQTVNVLFADGHVQSIDFDVDAKLMLSWMTPAQSDPLGGKTP